MAKNIAFKFINSRKVSFALLASDLAIGYTTDAGQFVGLFTVPDFLLKKSETKGYYYQAPSKKYIKNGEPVKDDNGYDRYLEFFRLFTEKGAGAEPDKFSPTKASFEARKHLIGLLVKELETLGGASAAPAPSRAPARAAAPSAPARATRPAAAPAVIAEEEVPFGTEDDDDMPF